MSDINATKGSDTATRPSAMPETSTPDRSTTASPRPTDPGTSPTLVTAAMKITSVAPSSGPATGGTAVTINGQNFGPLPQVFFGGNFATNTVRVSASQITTKTPPADLVGPVNIEVVDLYGNSAMLGGGFTYQGIVTAFPPDVTSVAPASGPVAGGTAVEILGQHFSLGARVMFGVVEVAAEYVNNGKLRATTPASPAGIVALTVLNIDGQADVLPNAFQFTPPIVATPTVTVTAPAGGESAQAGSQFVIRWTSADVAAHDLAYSLDGGFTFTNIATDVSASAQSYAWTIPPSIVPPGAASASVRIRVTARNGTQIASDLSDGPLTITPQPSTGMLYDITDPSMVDSEITVAAGLTATFRRQSADVLGGGVTCTTRRTLKDFTAPVALLGIARPKVACADGSIRICDAAGGPVDCGKYFIDVQTAIDTPPGDYPFRLTTAAFQPVFENGEPTQARIVLHVAQPRVRIDPGTDKTVKVVAGKEAKYKLTVVRDNYLGPFEPTAVTDPNGRVLVRFDPPMIPARASGANATETLTMFVSTEAPKAGQTPGTPLGRMMIDVGGRVPAGAGSIPLQTTGVSVNLDVDVIPDVQILISPAAAQATQGATAEYNVQAFYYNIQTAIEPVFATTVPGATERHSILNQRVLMASNGVMVEYKLLIDIPAAAPPDIYVVVANVQATVDEIDIDATTTVALTVNSAAGTVLALDLRALGSTSASRVECREYMVNATCTTNGAGVNGDVALMIVGLPKSIAAILKPTKIKLVDGVGSSRIQLQIAQGSPNAVTEFFVRGTVNTNPAVTKASNATSITVGGPPLVTLQPLPGNDRVEVFPGDRVSLAFEAIRNRPFCSLEYLGNVNLRLGTPAKAGFTDPTLSTNVLAMPQETGIFNTKAMPAAKAGDYPFTLFGSAKNTINTGAVEMVMVDKCDFKVVVKEAGLIVTAPNRGARVMNATQVIVRWKVRPAQQAGITYTITLALDGYSPVVLTTSALLPSFSFVLDKPQGTAGINIPATITVVGNGILTPDGRPFMGTTEFVAV